MQMSPNKSHRPIIPCCSNSEKGVKFYSSPKNHMYFFRTLFSSNHKMSMNYKYPPSCFSCLLLKTVLNRLNLFSNDPLFTCLFSTAYGILYFKAAAFKYHKPASCIPFSKSFPFQHRWLVFLCICIPSEIILSSDFSKI